MIRASGLAPRLFEQIDTRAFAQIRQAEGRCAFNDLWIHGALLSSPSRRPAAKVDERSDRVAVCCPIASPSSPDHIMGGRGRTDVLASNKKANSIDLAQLYKRVGVRLRTPRTIVIAVFKISPSSQQPDVGYFLLHFPKLHKHCQKAASGRIVKPPQLLI